MSEFVMYPKCLYRNADFSGDTLTVSSEDHEAQAKADGWLTCEQIHGLEPMPTAAEVIDSKGEVVLADEPAPKRKAKK